MDGQLEVVKHRICRVDDEILETKHKLAAAKEAKKAEQEKLLLELLLSLNMHLNGLQEEKNILLRSQAPSKPCLQLVHTGMLFLSSHMLHFIQPCLRLEGLLLISHMANILVGCERAAALVCRSA